MSGLPRPFFSEEDRSFRLAVKRVIADVLDRAVDAVKDTDDPVLALRLLGDEIRNEDAV
jgi:hypothetical protein